MIDNQVLSITPKLKSELSHKGHRSLFTVIDDQDRKFSCWNHRLYMGIEEGVRVDIILADGNPTLIMGISSFKSTYPPIKSKAPINKAEAQFFNLMEGAGWETTKKGWPDFACFKDGKLVLIEVKPKRSHRLKYWQSKIMLELVKHGIKCYRWSPDGGFEPVMESVKFPINLP